MRRTTIILMALSALGLSVAASAVANLPWFRALPSEVLLGATAVLLVATILAEVRRHPGSVAPTPRATTSLLDSLMEELALTVATQWRTEERVRRVRDPYPLPVRWGDAAQSLVDHWENIRRTRPGVSSPPLHLGASLDAISETYAQIPSGRLVILGAPGAGKTVLGIRLLLDLLEERNPGAPVPVVLSLSSWNPSVVSFHSFASSALMDAYPAMGATTSTGQTLATVLLETNRLLLILDGFDELNAGLHSAALRELGATTSPMIVLSRTDPYVAAVEDTAPLSAAAVITIRPLEAADIIAYLPRTADDEVRPLHQLPVPLVVRLRTLVRSLAGKSNHSIDSRRDELAVGQQSVWQPIVSELVEHPQSAASRVIAAALSTPLMVSLARVVYGRGSRRHPSELLAIDSFPDEGAIERHLLALYVTGVYAQAVREAGTDSSALDPDAVASRAELAFADLARRLASLESDYIDWWRLRDSVPKTGRVLLSGAIGAILGGAALFPLWQLGAGLGIGFGLLPAVASQGRHPLRTPLTLRGRMREMIVLLLVGVLGGIGGGVAFRHFWPNAEGLFFSSRAAGAPESIAAGVIHLLLGGLFGVLLSRVSAMSLVGSSASLVGGASSSRLPSYAFRSLVLGGAVATVGGVIFGATGAFVLGIAAGCAGGLMAASEASVDMTTVSTPVSLLGIDRRNTVFEMVALGLVTLGAVTLVAVARLGLADGTALGLGVGLVVGVGNASAGTAWGHWTLITRPWLALASPVPLRVVAFLVQAHALGVLRQAGPSFQFRHVRLQEYLVSCAER